MKIHNGRVDVKGILWNRIYSITNVILGRLRSVCFCGLESIPEVDGETASTSPTIVNSCPQPQTTDYRLNSGGPKHPP